jgi:hypothetical protein
MILNRQKAQQGEKVPTCSQSLLLAQIMISIMIFANVFVRYHVHLEHFRSIIVLRKSSLQTKFLTISKRSFKCLVMVNGIENVNGTKSKDLLK